MDGLGDDAAKVQPISSPRPERDTPAALAEYVPANDVASSSDWHAGTDAAIRDVSIFFERVGRGCGAGWLHDGPHVARFLRS